MERTRIGIIGGGPGGLMTAYLLQKKYADTCEVVLLEASDRLGGKLQTGAFDCAPVHYEAGAAECYDYSCVGEDALHRLVEELGLETRPMKGQSVVLNGSVLCNDSDIEGYAGADTLAAIRAFLDDAARLLSKEQWREECWRKDNAHPWAYRTCQDVLDDVRDPLARKYLQVVAHSDIATEPHNTNGLNGLKNFLMNVPGYIECYTIVGGMSALAGALAARLGSTRVELGSSVDSVEGLPDGAYRVGCAGPRGRHELLVDTLIVALPPERLGSIAWRDERLRRAVAAHRAHFDNPGHYLRVSMLFERPFWQHLLKGSWFMLDAYGGTCVYDESGRHGATGYGVLGFLFAGTDALALGNLDETTLTRRALETLPSELQDEACAALMETRVHRWAMGVSAQPGGLPLMNPESSHVPDPDGHPGLLLVGGQLFDSTLNAVLKSAEFATDRVAAVPLALSSRAKVAG